MAIPVALSSSCPESLDKTEFAAPVDVGELGEVVVTFGVLIGGGVGVGTTEGTDGTFISGFLSGVVLGDGTLGTEIDGAAGFGVVGAVGVGVDIGLGCASIADGLIVGVGEEGGGVLEGVLGGVLVVGVRIGGAVGFGCVAGGD